MKMLPYLLLTLMLNTAFPQAEETIRTGSTKTANAQPSVDQILQKYFDAIGGKAVAERVKSRIMKGTLVIVNTGASGSYEVFSKAPNKFRSNAQVNNFGTLSQGFNGAVAWTGNPMTGAAELAGEFQAALKREADLLRDCRLKEHYAKLALKEIRKLDGKEVCVVEATPAEGWPDFFYFDARTGLLVRCDTQRPPQEGMVTMESYFDEYREVDGIQLPFRIRQYTPVYNMEIQFHEIRHNMPMDEEIFDPPLPLSRN